MIKEIKLALDNIKAEHDVKILFACESGSRAWGFPSIDSDYDVRFIYLYSKDKYLSIDNREETLDLPINEVLDVNGWELTKALRLLRNSNAPLFEWLQSPVIYEQDTEFIELITPVIANSFSLRAGMHHYTSMVRNALKSLQTEEVRIKKYFYALRPLLAALWIARKNELPPMELGALRKQIDDTVWQEKLDNLLTQKSISNEKSTIPRLDYFNQFIEQELTNCDAVAMSLPKMNVNTEILNNIFRSLLNEFSDNT